MPSRKAPRDHTSFHAAFVQFFPWDLYLSFPDIPKSLTTLVRIGAPWNFGIHDFRTNLKSLIASGRNLLCLFDGSHGISWWFSCWTNSTTLEEFNIPQVNLGLNYIWKPMSHLLGFYGHTWVLEPPVVCNTKCCEICSRASHPFFMSLY